MRTTLTIDDDIAKDLEARMRREGKGLKEVVNELLRRGLSAGEKPLPKRKAFRIETFSSPLAPGIDVGKLNRLNDELEVAEFLRKRSAEEP